MKKNILGAVSTPPSSLLSGFRLEIKGNREAVLEGCGGVLEYGEDTVRVRAGKMSVRFTGRDIKIKCLTADSLVVEGYLTGLEFIT
ncbi:YabP/YqfC family sporulation protein [Clostridium minihomine]|uniref:YabP/YqfC family sporulation protein n=1 Tax=Clostridium minihomine TaxID=2045012 RepID=UPI000C76F249|nr:YabP/YqfC family sporulation protein [Clostridium minihomine]